jgi:hypothetical protein
LRITISKWLFYGKHIQKEGKRENNKKKLIVNKILIEKQEVEKQKKKIPINPLDNNFLVGDKVQ